MTSVRIARGVNLLPADIDDALKLLQHRRELVEGVKAIRHYLITMACQEDYEGMIDICDSLLEMDK